MSSGVSLRACRKRVSLRRCIAVCGCVTVRQRGTTMNPGELKREITQLTEEKNQLTEKVRLNNSW